MAKIIKNNKNFASIFTPGAKLFARMGTKAVDLQRENMKVKRIHLSSITLEQRTINLLKHFS